MVKKKRAKKGGNQGQPGTRAKKATQRRWEKRKDAIFLAAVGTVGYVVGHGVDTLQTPVLKHVGQVVDLLMSSGLLKHIAPSSGHRGREPERAAPGRGGRSRLLYRRGEAEAKMLADHGAAFKELAAAIAAEGPGIEEKWNVLSPAGQAEILALWETRLNAFSGTEWSPLLEYLHQLLATAVEQRESE
ncbi:hypothetical protein G3A43_07885 [Paraburkholderia aspalathi]|nr:hypothetical protein [Paraburkholderia aspalathi]MBK3780176.1 hypothetical protein [Paraburkholderia aspalathi]